MEKISFKTFNLDSNIISALEKLGYEFPLEVQSRVIPLALENKDIIVKSRTGSGKTAAFGIPACEIIDIEKNDPQILVLTPTRELAVQVKEDISNIGRLKKIRCAAIFGKQPMSMQLRVLKQRVHVVVGTPGRTIDHIERESLNLNEIKYLIIDEADKMLNMGFIDQVEQIIKTLPKNRVTMLFSATMPERIESLCKKYMDNPTMIEIENKETDTIEIKQLYYAIEGNKKLSLLNKIIWTERPDSCIIFCNTKEMVDNVVEKMKFQNYSCDGLHGGMEQKDRLDKMQKFKRGEFRFLVATDVAARGIHIEDISHVINYDVPVEKESFVHRIGRTGRAGSKGKAITFVSSKEYKLFSSIEEYVGYKIPEGKIPSSEEVDAGRKLFKIKQDEKTVLKEDKSAVLNEEITKLYINAGKKKKVRAGDIVGAITNIKGVTGDDIGIIDILDHISYVDILNGKGSIVLKGLNNGSIKKKKVKVQIADK